MNTCCNARWSCPLLQSPKAISRLHAQPDHVHSMTNVSDWTCTRRRAVALGLISASPFLNPDSVLSRESSIYDFQADIYGSPKSLGSYKDQVLNLNYPGLRTLVEKYGERGFDLIAFPCNQFGQQAPGTSQEEREFAIRKFGFEFDVFDKIEVNGLGAHPLYKYLKRQQPISSPNGGYSRRTTETGAIEWNYTKFLVNRQGKPVRRYSPSFDPLDFEGDVVNLLNGKDPLPDDCLVNPEQRECLF